MKKITKTILAGFASILLSVSAFAGSVVLNNNSAYEVTIDGATYNANNQYAINDLQDGSHLIAVYQVVSSGGIFSPKKRNLIQSRQFTLNSSSNVTINVSQTGQIQVQNNGANGGSNTGSKPKKPKVNEQDDNEGNNGGQYGNSEGKGRGNKYGHYKNKKSQGGKGKKRQIETEDND